MVEAAVRAISGEMIKLDVDPKYEGCSDHFTGHIRCTPKRFGFLSQADLWAFETAPKECLDVSIESIEGVLLEKFKLGGGEIQIFDCPKLPDAKWACWIGPWHIAHAMFYEPKCKSWDIVEFFSRVNWLDTKDGLTCKSGLLSGSHIEAAIYLLEVTGIGTMLFEKKSHARDKIPSFLGFESLLGEIWKLAPAIGSTVERLLLVTDSVVCTLDPWDVPWKGGPGKDPDPKDPGPEDPDHEEPEDPDPKDPDPENPKPGSAEAAAQFLNSLLDCSWGK